MLLHDIRSYCSTLDADRHVITSRRRTQIRLSAALLGPLEFPPRPSAFSTPHNSRPRRRTQPLTTSEHLRLQSNEQHLAAPPSSLNSDETRRQNRPPGLSLLPLRPSLSLLRTLQHTHAPAVTYERNGQILYATPWIGRDSQGGQGARLHCTQVWRFLQEVGARSTTS